MKLVCGSMAGYSKQTMKYSRETASEKPGTYFVATIGSSFLSPEHCPTPLRYQTSSGLLHPQERAPFASLYGDGHSFFLRGSHD